VKWKGHDEDLEWYTARHFIYAPQMLRDFHLANPTADGPPKMLPQWQEAFNEGRELYTELEDNTPMSKKERAEWFKGCLKS